MSTVKTYPGPIGVADPAIARELQLIAGVLRSLQQQVDAIASGTTLTAKRVNILTSDERGRMILTSDYDMLGVPELVETPENIKT